jgi:ribosome-binding protein aMBF1 (putative translation factor)
MTDKDDNNEGTKTADAVEIMRRRFGDDPERRARLEQIKENMALGSQIYAARTAAGLTQRQLAERIGTSQSVISDLEDAEYEGDTTAMLCRVMSALNETPAHEIAGGRR